MAATCARQQPLIFRWRIAEIMALGHYQPHQRRGRSSASVAVLRKR